VLLAVALGVVLYPFFQLWRARNRARA